MNIWYRSVFWPKLLANIWGHVDKNIQKIAVSSREESKSKKKKILSLTAPFPIKKKLDLHLA